MQVYREETKEHEEQEEKEKREKIGDETKEQNFDNAEME